MESAQASPPRVRAAATATGPRAEPGSMTAPQSELLAGEVQGQLDTVTAQPTPPPSTCHTEPQEEGKGEGEGGPTGEPKAAQASTPSPYLQPSPSVRRPVETSLEPELTYYNHAQHEHGHESGRMQQMMARFEEPAGPPPPAAASAAGAGAAREPRSTSTTRATTSIRRFRNASLVSAATGQLGQGRRGGLGPGDRAGGSAGAGEGAGAGRRQTLHIQKDGHLTQSSRGRLRGARREHGGGLRAPGGGAARGGGLCCCWKRKRLGCT